jgi:hypothetical protein
VNSRRRFLFNQRDGQINFILAEPFFELRRVTFAQRQFQSRKFFAHVPEQLREMLAQHNRRGADADVPGLSALQFTRNFFKVRKNGRMNSKSFSPGGVSANGRR